MNNVSKRFIFFVLIFSLALPLSVVFDALTVSDVYAAKKERKKPPKARRTQTMSKKVGADFIKAQEALGEEQGDKALKILNNLLRNPDLRDFEKATIVRLKGYVYAEQEDYPKSMSFLQEALSYNALAPQDQLDLQFGIAQLYLAIDQWDRGLSELLEWFDNAEALGNPPGPSAHALLAQIYLYFASETPKDSPEEKQFYRKAEPHAEIAVLQATEPRENWYQIYLSILLFDDRYEESLPLLEAMVYRFPEKKSYHRQLAALYAELKREDDSFYIQQIMYSKDMLEKHAELLRLAQLYLYYEVPYKAALILEKELEAERIKAEIFNKVITLEPDLLNFYCLLENTKKCKNVVPFRAALGDKSDMIQMTSPKTNNVGMHYIDGAGDIPQITIDSLNIKHLDLIHLDIEGYELFALKGAEETIRRCKPTVALEYNKLADKYGYTMYDLNKWFADRNYVNHSRHESDFVFIPK